MKSRTEITAKGTRRNNLIIPLVIILCLMVAMVIYTSNAISRVSVSNIQEVGEDKISGVAAQLENYLDTSKSVLWVTADTVDHMVHNGGTTEQIHNYIVEETEKQKQQFDENTTGIYGYIMGEYLDGLNWEPPEGYDPVERDWYKAAIAEHGDVTIVSPYVDAQTGSIVITICRQLSNPSDVLAVDAMMNKIQEMIEDLQIKEKGFGFIVNEDGMLIAHPDESRKGKYLNSTEEQKRFMEKVLTTCDGNFEMEIDGKLRTIFVKPIMDQWYVIITISNEELYAEHWRQIAVNVLICTVIFILIALFYYLGYKNEQGFSRRMEEMKMEEQKQAYETRVLKLEKEAADRANQAKSNFLADMSHEIRTPINAVLGMNEMIIRESNDGRESTSADKQEKAFENIRDYAVNIENAGNNLLSIINDILDFSKIEAGKLSIKESNYELSSLIRDVTNMIYFRARDKDLEFSVDVDEKLPDELYGDKVRVRQIITNLLTNAVKYTDQGSVRMCVRSDEKVFRPGETLTLKISVKDTGIGIRKEDIQKLFSKFQRVDLDRNSTVEGAGLGLAITQSLLTMMGGEISVDSSYGEGSCFTVTLPQMIVSCNPVGSFRANNGRDENGDAIYTESFRAPEARILVVDDTRMNIAVVIGLLKKTEVQIESAINGTDAIEMAKHKVYDLILMDQRMPGVDGTEALIRIREEKEGPNFQTPVICMTADAIIGAKERYTAEGFTDYLPKPVTGETLEKTLIRYLPKEKMIVIRRETEPESRVPRKSGQKQNLYPGFQEAGIDFKSGLFNCQEDEELYKTLLREFEESAEEKQKNIQAYYDTKEWKQYSILVHALKSTSRLIGADTLSGKAAELEKAADEGRYDEIAEKHEAAMKQYLYIAGVIRDNIHAEKPDDPDESILEFYPQE